VTDFKIHLSMLSPKEKLEALEEMGFRERTPDEHAVGCASRQGSGLRCTCLPPVTAWVAPSEVRQYMGEDDANRKKFGEKRWAFENDDEGSNPGLWVTYLENTAPRHKK
jgi:hypothetical protein